MAFKVSRNLYIGLGGTGSSILIQVKKAIIEKYGEVPPSVEFLVMDTDSDVHNVSSKIKNKEIFFDKDEVLDIPIKNPHKLKNFDHIKSWLSDKVEPLIVPSDRGAGQIRSLGRFAFFENYHSKGIMDLITNKIESINANTIHNNQTFEPSGFDTMIHLVFSPCGGTGAGTFIDTVMSIKAAYGSLPVYGWMVMPDFYKDFPFTRDVTKNAYASLRAIDHMQGKDNTEGKNWSNYDVKDPFKVSYDGQNFIDLGSSEFFSYIYLFDKTMMDNSIIQNIDHVKDRIARTLFLHVTEAGDKLKSLYNNNKDYLYPSSELAAFKRRNYSSMGLAEIILDRDYLKSIRRLKAVNFMIDSMNQSKSVHSSGECELFIDENNLREDRGQDDIIDRLYPMNTLKISVQSLLPGDFGKDCHIELLENCQLQLKNIQTNVLLKTDENLDLIKSSFATNLKEKIEAIYSETGCIVVEKQFLNCLLGSFEGMRSEMIAEGNEHSINIDNQRKILTGYQEAIIEDENGFNPIGRSGRIKQSCNDYVDSYKRLIIEEVEKIRKNKAEDFLNSIVNIIKQKTSENDRLSQLVSDLNVSMHQKLQGLTNRSVEDGKDFEIYIHIYFKDLMDISSKEFSITDAFSQIDLLSLKDSTSMNEIYNSLVTYIDSASVITDIENIKLEELIEKLPANKRKEVITRLDKQSEVCIKIDDVTFSQNTPHPKMENLGMLLVPDADKTIFTKGSDVISNLSNNSGLTLDATLETATSNNPDKITFLKIKGMFPANAIHNIAALKSAHEMSVKNGGYHFADKYFEKSMDLIDGPQNEELLEFFAIGSALGMINLDRGSIKFKGKSGRPMTIVPGTRNKNNRAVVFKHFSENKAWINEIKEKYDNVLNEEGKPKIAELFKTYHDKIFSPEILGKLMDSIDSESDESTHIWAEKDAIKKAAMDCPITGAENW